VTCVAPTRSSQEPLEQHQFTARPWNEIGVDLCEFHGRMLVVVSDYYSNYIEVESLNKMTSGEVMKC